METPQEQQQTQEPCPVCCDTYNKALRQMVVCEFGDCKWNACKTCIRIYLENTTTDPNCMQCHRLWSKKFMVEKLNRSFVEGDLRAAKRKILVERAISQLPETMPAAKKQRDIDEEEEKIKLLRGKGELIKLQLRETMMQIDAACLTIQRIKRGAAAATADGSGAPEVERRRFIMACPNNECRGFLSSQYKCDLCTNFTCVDCHEMIGQSKTDPHTCDPANVESATLIKKETKPCPGCNARISKISGCDQMWCTVCHIAFSYNTGRVDTGVVHNPHFYQFQQTQQTNGAAAAAQPPNNRRNGPCGTTLCSYQEFRSITRQLETEDRRQRFTTPPTNQPLEELKKTLNELHRTINHLAGVELPDIRRRMETLINHEPIRVAYILQRVSKEEMAAKIYRDDNLRQKYLEIVNVLEVLVVVGIDSFNRILAAATAATAPYTTASTTTALASTTTDRCLQEIENYHALRLYCNDQMKSISLTYSQTVPFINTNFALSHKRYKSAKKVKTEASTATTESVNSEIETVPTTPME